MNRKTSSKPFAGLATAWTHLTDFSRARWKLTGIYILLLFVLLSIFTGVLLFALDKERKTHERNINIEWQKKNNAVREGNIVIVQWQENQGDYLDKEHIFGAQEIFINSIQMWMVFIEFSLIILGGFLSFFLSGKTLRPIQQKNEKQRQFLQDMSHELKNPLSALKTSLEVAKQQKKWTSAEATEMLTDLAEEVSRLVKTTNDLLLLEKQKEEEKPKQQDIDVLIQKTLSSLEIVAKKRNITLKKKLQPYVCKAQEDDIKRMVFNIVHNAIKFSKPNSSVEILLSEKGILSVQDTGIGISQTDISHIFDRFYKADVSRAFDKESGSGLGLAIVKNIAEKYGWNIEVESEKNKGTTMTIVFE